MGCSVASVLQDASKLWPRFCPVAHRRAKQDKQVVSGTAAVLWQHAGSVGASVRPRALKEFACFDFALTTAEEDSAR